MLSRLWKALARLCASVETLAADVDEAHTNFRRGIGLDDPEAEPLSLPAPEVNGRRARGRQAVE